MGYVEASLQMVASAELTHLLEIQQGLLTETYSNYWVC